MVCFFVGASTSRNIVVNANTCPHNEVEHYSATDEHVEHWACCSCHTAWSDSSLENIIGNTVNDRTKIDIARTYSYNSESGKIEFGRDGEEKQYIVPAQYVSLIKYTGTNSNVIQFASNDLSVNTNTKIVNPEAIRTTINLSEVTKSTFVYWNDGHVGFQQSGAFSSYDFGSYLFFENLILRNGNNDYFVIGFGGCAYSDKKGYPLNMSGYFENKIIDGFQSNGNYYVDLAAKMDLTNWSISGDQVGEDWTQPGGVSYRFTRVRNGTETSYAKLDNSVSIPNGTFPTGIKELTLTFKNTLVKNIRIGLDGAMGFVKGDKIILKAGSIFTDDGNGKNAVLVHNDIEFIFNGTIFSLYLGEVDLSNGEGENWDGVTFRLANLSFDLTYFYETQKEGQWSSDEHAVLNMVELEFRDVKTNSVHRNNNTYGKLVYYNNNDLVGIKGDIDVDDYNSMIGDTVSIGSGTYITINAIGTFVVSNGVKFRLTNIIDDNTNAWVNVSNDSDYYEPVYDSSKSIGIGAWSYMNSISNSQLEGLHNADFNLLVGNYTVIQDETQKADLLTRGQNYDIDFLLRPHPNFFDEDWTPSYYNEPNFLGYMVEDEPFYMDKSTIASKSNVWKNRSYTKDFFVNLNPIYCDPETLGTNDYELYIREFVEECNLTTVSFDNYSLYQQKSFSWSSTKIRDTWLQNFDICSYYANKNNIPLSYSFLTSQHYLGSNFRYINPSVDELKYQMYMGMAFGANSLVHYLLYSTSNDYTYPIIDADGNFTETYNKVKQANSFIRNWDSVYMNHKYVGVTAIEGQSSTTGLIGNKLKYTISTNSTGVVNSISSNYDVLLSHFVDGGNNKAFMLTNLTMPSSSISASVNISLAPTYKAVKIYCGNQITIVKLENGSTTISIPSSSAAFVVPLGFNQPL